MLPSRRRVEDEGEEEGGPDAAELDDDSQSEGSLISNDDDAEIASAISGKHTATTTSPGQPKHVANAEAKVDLPDGKAANKPGAVGLNDVDMMMNGLKISDQADNIAAIHYDDMARELDVELAVDAVTETLSTAQMDQQQESPFARRRREHEEYKQKRDADPAFVPNRGAFFMHDHRHAGPAANGFRPFGRGRGRGRGGFGGPFAPMQ